MFAGTGNGALSVSEETVLKECGAMPAASSRCSVGRAASATAASLPTAEFDGLGVDSGRHADNPQKARILLMLALTKTGDPKELRRIFSEY